MANILTLSGAGPLGSEVKPKKPKKPRRPKTPASEKVKQDMGDGCACHWNPLTKRGVKVCTTNDPKYRSGKRFAGSCSITPPK
jgi:hypothetical protein